MRGIITLKPIDEKSAIGGMRAVTIFFGQQAIVTIGTVYGPNCRVFGECGVHTVRGEYLLSELKQIVVQYEHEYFARTGQDWNKSETRILPLHPEDWQTALSLIGKEVEFSKVNKDPYSKHIGEAEIVAKLILPKQEENWLDVTKRYKEETGSSAFASNAFAKWLTANYLPPKRIKQ